MSGGTLQPGGSHIRTVAYELRRHDWPYLATFAAALADIADLVDKVDRCLAGDDRLDGYEAELFEWLDALAGKDCSA